MGGAFSHADGGQKCQRGNGGVRFPSTFQTVFEAAFVRGREPVQGKCVSPFPFVSFFAYREPPPAIAFSMFSTSWGEPVKMFRGGRR